MRVWGEHDRLHPATQEQGKEQTAARTPSPEESGEVAASVTGVSDRTRLLAFIAWILVLPLPLAFHPPWVLLREAEQFNLF